jgi:uncharacterized protein (DUF885 family)
MRSFRQNVVTLAVLLVVALGVSCRHTEPAASAPAAAPPAAPIPPKVVFKDWVDRYFDAIFAFQPSMATVTGDHRFDGQLEDRSEAAILRHISVLDGMLSELQALRAEGLVDADEAIDAELIENELKSDLFDLRDVARWRNNPMVYARVPAGGVDALMKRDIADAPERLRRAISRMKGVPAIYAAARANLRNPPREHTEMAVRIAKGTVGFFESALPMWAKTAAQGDANLQRSFDEANAQALSSTQEFVTWMEKTLLPQSKGAFALGEERFKSWLVLQGIPQPLPELKAKGQAQLDKDFAAFVATAKKIDAKKSPAQVVKALSAKHPKPEDLIVSVRKTIEASRKFLVDKQLVSLPSERLPRVEEMPAFDRAGTFASMDMPGPLETRATESFYYVTPVEKEWPAKQKEEHLSLFNPWVTAIITAHEAFPGHFLQFLWADKFPTKTRKLLSNNANAEGWAHYCEQLVIEQGFGGEDPRYTLAQLQEALLRDVRYLVAIGLHAEGMTVEQATKLLREKAFEEQAVALEEAKRGVYDPYLYYTYGKMEVLALRDEYLQRPGATLKSFHDAFIAQGSVPMALVRRQLLRP